MEEHPYSAETDFAQRIIQVLDEGSFTSTYKFALLLALIEAAEEVAEGRTGAVAAVPTSRLAQGMLDLYWPQSDRTPAGTVLRQAASGRNAGIIEAIQTYAEPNGGALTFSSSRAKVIDPQGYQTLARRVELILYKDVLRRLQIVSSDDTPFIYEVPPGAATRSWGSQSDFRDGVVFLPGAIDNLIRFGPLLRPLVQRRWAQRVTQFPSNHVRDPGIDLERFLFGADRISLSSITEGLRDVAEGRCFFCRKVVGRRAQIDHFIPWSRFRDNGIHNLVFADADCNGSKRAYLPAVEHLRAWMKRFLPGTREQLGVDEVSRAAQWEQNRGRTLGAARTAYLFASASTLLWSASTGLQRIGRDEVRDALDLAN